MGRRTETRQRTGAADAPEMLLSKLDYNDVGQLKSKAIGDGLQTLNYAYNERGWLRTMTSRSNLFFLDLRYNTPDSVTPQYNGNITQMQYLTTKVTQPGYKTFGYTYDKLNRLTVAASTAGALDEQMTYDQMGNIIKLVRGGTGGGTLNYSVYEGNQLKTVTGYSPRSYLYDLNGNARSDGTGKNITYNMLNLPRSVTSGPTTVATYTYDANGNKLKNTGTDGTWDYVNGVVYKNNAIDFVSTEEGRVKLIGGAWNYEYNLKDHLGNTRVSIDKYQDAPRVIQEDEYYSFGLRKPTGGYDYSNNNRYLYNGKEIQTDLANQYDYGARFYDPVIGRFNTIDPMSDNRNWLSPYNYVQNNPILKIDPNGALDDNYDIYDDGTITVQRTQDETNTYTYHRKGGETVDLGTYERDKDTNLTNFAANTSENSPFVLDNSNGKTYMDGDFAAGVLGAAQDYQDQTGNTVQITQLTNSEGMHSGHGGALGQYADVRYANKNGDKVESVWTSGSNFDKSNSQVLANSFRKFGFDGPASILTENAKGNGPALQNTRFVNGNGKFHHKHHIHLQKYNYSHLSLDSGVPVLFRPITPYSKPFSPTLWNP